jgi:hypothetical protein
MFLIPQRLQLAQHRGRRFLWFFLVFKDWIPFPMHASKGLIPSQNIVGYLQPPPNKLKRFLRGYGATSHRRVAWLHSLDGFNDECSGT